MIKRITKKSFVQQLNVDLLVVLTALNPPTQVRDLYGAPFSYLARRKFLKTCNPAQFLADHEDRWILLSLLLYAKPQNILEIGTEKGKMTALLSALAPAEASLWTVDLPPLQTHDIQYAPEANYTKGEFMNLLGGAHKVKQVFCSSLDLKNQQLPKMDFCFIDANHSYDFVKSDTEYVLGQLKQPGIVVWHDYKPAEPGVLRYLDELSAERTLYQVAGSAMNWMVFYVQGFDFDFKKSWVDIVDRYRVPSHLHG